MARSSSVLRGPAVAFTRGWRCWQGRLFTSVRPLFFSPRISCGANPLEQNGRHGYRSAPGPATVTRRGETTANPEGFFYFASHTAATLLVAPLLVAPFDKMRPRHY